jgi:hypothetical protein
VPNEKDKNQTFGNNKHLPESSWNQQNSFLKTMAKYPTANFHC